MTLMKLLAIDLGASSGRVMQAIYNGHRIELSEVHRFKNEPVFIGISYICLEKSRLGSRKLQQMGFLFDPYPLIHGEWTMPT
mgnify:CR=1 FL=1